MILKRSLIVASISTLLLAVPFPAATQTLLRVATPGALTGALPIYLGEKKGIFGKYGLRVEVIATRNEQMNMQALMSDSVQFLTTSSTGLFYLSRQGLDAVGIASWNNASPYSVGGRTDAFIRFMLAKVGIDAKTDVQILPLSGGSAVRLAAVVSGNLDATLI